jgi:hypothetical protein
MAADRPRRADATGIALAAGAAALLFGIVFQGYHLIADNASPPPGPAVTTPAAPPKKPRITPPDRPYECAQVPHRCDRGE